ncbi:MAG: VWA domain-containing protein [Acidobacteria bacterium]|nr:VWA domain-containing protein [Acidobacteriota bacterium]
MLDKDPLDTVLIIGKNIKYADRFWGNIEMGGWWLCVFYTNCFAGAILSCSLMSGVIFGQDDVLQIETNLVKVPVTISDRDGRYLTGLSKEDFAIFENGKEQAITFFEAVDTPVSVLLLLDLSGSMNQYLVDIGKASAVFISKLRDSDTIIVAGFVDDKKLHILSEPVLKKNFKTLIRLKERYGDSFTTTFDAVENAIKYMSRFSGRKAIVLFSDGELYGRGASVKSNFRDAEEDESLIYTVRFGNYPISLPADKNRNWRSPLTQKEKNKRVKAANDYLNGLSYRTGGKSFEVSQIDNLSETFHLISDELGRQVLVGYSPEIQPEDGERRTITVKVSRPDVAVRSRNEVVYKKRK